uniref:TBC1 domain family member 16-like isoform X2 n=1 Tax=Myxine glutinosa TaxID=7769 RepID=UPI00358EC300
MSFGHFLRRASLLLSTELLGTSESPAHKHGGIVYSKNNVCVHPPEELNAGKELHYPGYLCIQKEGGHDGSLLLSWIPNSRIQREDEEALRYITPDGSPIHRANRSEATHRRKTFAAISTLTEGTPATSPIKRLGLSLDSALLLQSLNKLDSLPISNNSSFPRVSVTTMERQHNAGGYCEKELSLCSDCALTSSDFRDDHDRALGTCFSEGTLCSQSKENDGPFASETCRQKQPDMNPVHWTFAGRLSHPDTQTTGSQLWTPSDLVIPLTNGSQETMDSIESMEFGALNRFFSQSNGGTTAEHETKHGIKKKEDLDLKEREQLHAVFSVDLGHMKSLRIFFSDCTESCGHLVVASRESQYKIFHFHHGGLTRLAQVLNNWHQCTASSPLALEGDGYLQFLIADSAIPHEVGEHPEEGCYPKLSRSLWLQHMDEEGHVMEDYKIRRLIFFAGMDPEMRGEVWPFLIKAYEFQSSSAEREKLRQIGSDGYAELQRKRLSMSQEEQEEFWKNVQYTVDRDVVRTDRKNHFYKGEDNPNVEKMRCILLNFAVHSPVVGYTQGMSDLLAPVLAEVHDEADTFRCFVGLMQGTIFCSTPCDEDMERQLTYLRELLHLVLPEFYDHLDSLGEDGLQLLFCHRWLLLCFKREFQESEALRMWEACWAHYQTDYFHLFICLAIVALYGGEPVDKKLAADATLLYFTNLAMHMNGEHVLVKARGLLHYFRLMPRIPCTLHGLCLRCSPGVWDSGYMPAVECVGEHADGFPCQYSPPSPASPAPSLPGIS